MASKSELLKQIQVLEDTNKWFKKQIEPEDCGWMHTTIDGNKHRIKVLKSNLKALKNGKIFKEKHLYYY